MGIRLFLVSPLRREGIYRILSHTHPLDVLSEDIELDVDLATDSERSQIGHVPRVWDNRYCEVIIACGHDRETYSVQCDASFFDDEVAILRVKIYSYEIGAITVLSDCANRPNCIDMPCDEVSIDAGLGSDTTFDVELVASLFTPKIGPREALDHREECI